MNKSGAAFAGVKLFLDANNNGKIDSGEVTITTDSSGNFSFKGVAAGTYRLTEVVPSGYQVTLPSVGYYTVTVPIGGSSTGHVFADARPVPAC